MACRADVEAVGRISSVTTILDVVCRITGMGFAAVARVTDDRWIACSVKEDIAFGLQPGGELRIETTICNEIRVHREPVIIGNIARDAAHSRHPAPALYGFRSYISIPIVLPDGAFFGTRCAIDPQPRALDKPEVLDTLRLFAVLIAFQLDAGRKVAETEAALLSEQETSGSREQFIAILGHDLRNPLMAVSAGAQLLLRHPDRYAEIVGHMERSISRMVGLLDNVLDLARGRLGGGITMMSDANGSMEPTIRHVVQELRTTHPDQVIDLVLDLQEPVVCDHPRIAQLLSNLLGNALTHGDPGCPVKVDAVSAHGQFRLEVSNGGTPIAPKLIPSLFHPFVRASIRPSQDNLGLGLYIANEVARAHGGWLNVTSTELLTCFAFTMPNGC